MKAPLAAVSLLALAACGKPAPLPQDAGYGPDPAVLAPRYELFTAIKLAPALGWSEGRTPRAAPGLAVNAFASGLQHPRWLHVLPNGDVLVAESDGPGEPVKRPKDVVMRWAMASVLPKTPPPNRISLLRDADGDGVAETRVALTPKLDSPFGMALVGDTLYVAETSRLTAFPFRVGETRLAGPGRKVADLPGGPIDHHWTKNVISAPGGKLLVTVGSNSNAGENGMENEVNRAAILEIDPPSGATRIYASGIRNPNGLDFEPTTGMLWTVSNERDEIGDDASPDFLTSVRPGGFYGWPYSYWGRHVDRRPYPPRPDLVARAIRPDYGLGAHTGSLGMTFARDNALGSRFASGAFVGQHGSWNRSRRSGYKVIFVPFAGGKPAGMPLTVLDGFLAPGGKSYGRPVGVEVDRQGALLVADDAGNTIWRVTARGAAPSAVDERRTAVEG